MAKLQMVDLASQYAKKIKTEIDQAVLEVIASTSFIRGAPIKTFKHNLEQYLGVNHVICKWYRCFTDCINGIGITNW